MKNLKVMVTSKNLSLILKNLNPKKFGPQKTWILRNGINTGLEKMSAFRELNKENVQCDLYFKNFSG